MRKVDVLRELSGFQGKACLVKTDDDKHYVVSSVHAFTGFETLVFPANEKGDVLDYLEVAGGRGVSRDEAIAEIAEMVSS